MNLEGKENSVWPLSNFAHPLQPITALPASAPPAILPTATAPFLSPPPATVPVGPNLQPSMQEVALMAERFTSSETHKPDFQQDKAV